MTTTNTKIINQTPPTLYKEFTLPSNYYKAAVKAAASDYENWERKANEGRRQCHNTLSGCEIGSLAEAAVIYWINTTYIPTRENKEGIKFNKLYCYGMEERRTGKMHYSKADIEVKVRGKDTNYKIEVKGVRPHQKHGQITQYHAEKYKKDRVGTVMFVEVDHSSYDGKAVCKIYKLATPTECLQAPLKPNHYGKLCHTLDVEC